MGGRFYLQSKIVEQRSASMRNSESRPRGTERKGRCPKPDCSSLPMPPHPATSNYYFFKRGPEWHALWQSLLTFTDAEHEPSLVHPALPSSPIFPSSSACGGRIGGNLSSWQRERERWCHWCGCLRVQQAFPSSADRRSRGQVWLRGCVILEEPHTWFSALLSPSQNL